MSGHNERKSPVAIEWRDSLSVNSKVIDEQHKSILNTLNNLVHSLNTGSNHDIIAEIINELIDQITRHFITEEEFMKAYGYPSLEEHTARHKEFIDKMIEYNTLFKDNAIGAVNGVVLFLEHWFEAHVLMEDMDYASYLTSD
ncbi:MAG: hemerythrin family protein [Nitrospinae bacterium]|nr:hemerythrin family protein [Nitrospinota bacterium]